MEAFLHIGAPKCGSSAIQEFFSLFPRGTCANGDPYSYCCLLGQSVLLPGKVRESLKESISGYRNSTICESIPQQRLLQMKSDMNAVEGNIVMSNESWLLGFLNRAFRNQVIKIAGGDGKRRVHLIGFVRPPVKWINSSWWQWGAWDHTIDMDQWVSGMINASKWINYIKNYSQDTSIDSVRFMPVRENVIVQLAEAAMIEQRPEMIIKSNKSLPSEVLEIFLRSDRLRVSQHDCNPDFIALRALRDSPFSYSPTPWFLSRCQIQQIIDETRDSVLSLLPLMTASDREYIEDDQSWWSGDHYTKYLETNDNKENTVEALMEKLSRYQNLSEDLLVKLVDAMEILAKHKLLDKTI